MNSRATGRYNLQQLGWSAFEDLCIQVMRVVLGETCTRFLPGRDLGRDGWFRGVVGAKLQAQNGLSGSFLIQCKHTSKAEYPLERDDLHDEVAKMREFAKTAPLNYLLMTNRRVSSTHEKGIRELFEAIPNVHSCTVLGETWIEDSIDSHTRLLRLVPRLYGIGDLSQILATSVQLQTAAVLEDLKDSLRTFVPTESYRRAEKALVEHGFAVLVGPPASGKSAIAANLCMVSIAQDVDVRVLRVENAEKFKETWSPADRKTIYWVDDVFGETTLDAERLREWSAALEKVEAARKRWASILFCTRDYILAEAETKLKRLKADIVNDARVRVEVTTLTTEERERILYNHIKDGDIPRERKSALKPFLRTVAAWKSFSPELARRLGSARFAGFPANMEGLIAFFDRPVAHFRDVIHGLSGSETAALAVCLFGNNNVPDPVPDHYLPEAVTETYNVSRSEVRTALERLEGSLIKRARSDAMQYWRLHHPSMVDALQEELVGKSSQFVLYLTTARLPALVRDTTMQQIKPNQRLVSIPPHLYPLVLERFRSGLTGNVSTIAGFLVGRASDAFLELIERNNPELIDAAVSLEPEPESDDLATALAARLISIDGGRMLDARRRALLVAAIEAGLHEHGYAGFLREEQLVDEVSELGELVRADAAKKFPSVRRLLGWYRSDMASTESVDYALEVVQAHVADLRASCQRLGLIDPEEEDPLVGAALSMAEAEIASGLEKKRNEILMQQDLRDDHDYQTWKDERHEREWEEKMSPFADVDE